ncbi:MAG: hypothetical protein Q8L90_10205, partial [Bacteroidota bacterium]|nr:hypothetical protein [Bacteroidota bacterium]
MKKVNILLLYFLILFISHNGYSFSKKQFSVIITVQPGLIYKDSALALPYYSAGIMKSNSKDYAEAIICFKKALEFDSTYASTYLNMAFAKRSLLDYKSALNDYNSALQLKLTWEESYEAYFNKSLTMALLENLQDAMAESNYPILLKNEYSDFTSNSTTSLNNSPPSVSKDSASAFPYFSAGVLKNNSKEYVDAIVCFTKALEHDPTLASAYLNRAYAKNKLLDYKSALSDYSKALQL